MATQNLDPFFRGDTKTFTFTVSRSSPSFDLTDEGTALVFTMKKKIGDSANVLQMSIGSGIAVASATTFTVTFAPADTSVIVMSQSTKFVYDIQWTEPVGRVTTIANGSVTLKMDVT